MGVVYKAEDLTLKRQVALKFLPSELTRDTEAKARFIHEAQAAAALNHPNIITVHEINEHEGQTFIVMEYLDGRTLKEKISEGARDELTSPLRIDEAIDIATEIGQGLAVAHAKGIVHRDLKPANIFITRDNVVKILDFGIAKLAGGQTRLTKTGTTIGTAAYMSPEQAMGKEVDRRADIWSLGVILYEMLAGKPPFQGEYAQAVIYSIINEEPKTVRQLRPEVGSGLERIVAQALAKDPKDRYQDLADLLADLQAVAEGLKPLKAKPRPLKGKILGMKKTYVLAGIVCLTILTMLALFFLFPKHAQAYDSIAVLPLENLSGDPEQEYIAEGMHDALITDLAQLGGLKRVIGRSSVMRFKKTSVSLRQIAQELKVAALVTGAVLRSGNRVRVTAQLINPVTEAQLWAHSYERDMRDVLSLQDEITSAISREIELRLTPQEKARLATARPVNPETYEAYLKGMYHLYKKTPEGFAKGLALLQQAIEKDPADPLPYAGLALAYPIIGHGPGGPIPPNQGFTQARQAALKALELDANSPQAHLALAAIKLYHDWDWTGAEKEFKRALELNPNLAEAHAHYGWYLHLFNRMEEGLAEAKRAVELDPLTPIYTAWVGWMYANLGKSDEAFAESQKALDMDSNLIDALYVLGCAYQLRQKFEDAIATARKLAAVNPDWKFSLAEAYAAAGRKEDVLGLVAEMEREDYLKFGIWIFGIQTALGNKEEAFRALKAAFDYCHIFLPWVMNNSEFVWRDDPRWQEFLRRMNFPATEKK